MEPQPPGNMAGGNAVSRAFLTDWDVRGYASVPVGYWADSRRPFAAPRAAASGRVLGVSVRLVFPHFSAFCRAS